MRLKRIYATVFAILIMAGQVSPVLAHGGEDDSALTRAADILSATFAAMVALIVVFVIWAPGHARLRPVQYGIIGLGMITALIHLLEGLNAAPWLILNGLGYVGLLGALYLPLGILARVRNQIRWTLIGYTLLTIILFFVTHPWGMYRGSFEWLGLGTKAIELSLIGLMFIEFKHRQDLRFIFKDELSLILNQKVKGG